MRVPDLKYFDYEFTELKFLALTTPYSGGQPLQINQRAYFSPDQRLQGKRVIGIESVANPNNNLFYNGVQILQSGIIISFMLTLVDKQGQEVIKNYPVKALHRFETFGNVRVFNHIIDIEKSYVVQTNQNFLPTVPLGLLFNFYTVSQ